MVTLLDKLLDFCSSLKLAICLILSLAFYLASATCYEARYGTRAVQDMIYGSQTFILLMAMLAINVMAAVLVRYPWKRKQTGFIITHCGIEILLLGCLISFRYSVDGRLSMRPGDKAESINLTDEEVGVIMPDEGGHERRHVFPVELWRDAGYPSLSHFVSHFLGNAAGLTAPPPEDIRWPAGHTVDWQLGQGATLQILDWMPAAIPESVIQASPDGFAAAMVHLGGFLPNGAAMDQDIPMVADGQGNGMVRPFGGTLEMDLWKARSNEEVAEFSNPPPASQLPEMGEVAIHLNGKRYLVEVTKDSLGKPQTLGDSGFKASVDDYILHAPPPQLPENHGQAAIASEPIDPQISVRLIGPAGSRKFLLAAWHPQFTAHLDDADASHHGVAAADDPLMWYFHPQTYVTTKEGTRGRLWLMETPDGKLLGRVFQLPTADQTTKPPFEIETGKELEHFWLNISLTVKQHVAKGALVDDFRAAHVTSQQMDLHSRAMKVALTVDGQRQETWLMRAGGPVDLTTTRGQVSLDYGFPEKELGFSLGLDNAVQKDNPMTEDPASWESDISVTGSNSRADGSHVIVMNTPTTVNGYVISQSGFDQTEQGPFSTFGFRRDPGWPLKDLGCALIVGGIFTMFYMKAYFQKTTPAAAAAIAAKSVVKNSNGQPQKAAENRRKPAAVKSA